MQRNAVPSPTTPRLIPTGSAARRLTRVIALAATVALAAGCPVLPDGTIVGTQPVPGQGYAGWNDPDDVTRTEYPFELADLGYVEEEHLFAGLASSYAPVGAWGQDGDWAALRGAPSQWFFSRMLVRRPAEAADFNGVVVVEWLNVTSGSDWDVTFMPMHRELLEQGYAWVGVSAQKVGVDHLRQHEPTRYGGLAHPGDAYAFDIFTRAQRAITHPTSPVLGGLVPEVVLAAGASQSAAGLITYINAVHPLERVYDGYLLLGDPGLALPVQPGTALPNQPHVRIDIDVPVLDVQFESELVLFDTFLSRQDDHARYRLWEVAGSNHLGLGEYGLSLTWPARESVPGDPCQERIGSGPTFAVAKAAIAALVRWVETGEAAAAAPRIGIADPAAPDPIARDGAGVALGGIRYPHVEVPTGRVDGIPNAAPPGTPAGRAFYCFTAGRTFGFGQEDLEARYPTADAYVTQFDAATDRAVADGFLLPEDGEALDAAAAAHPPVLPNP